MNAVPFLLVGFSLLFIGCARTDEPASQESPQLGEAIYEQACAACHDRGDDGAPTIGNTAVWSARSPEWPGMLKRHSRDGLLKMPERGGSESLTDDEIGAAVDFMTSQINSLTLPNFTVSVEAGRDVYLRNCGECHDSESSGAPVLGDTAAWAQRAPEWLAVLKQHAIDGYVLMPPKGGHSELPPEDVAQAVNYMVGWSRESPPAQQSDQPPENRPYDASE